MGPGTASGCSMAKAAPAHKLAGLPCRCPTIIAMQGDGSPAVSGFHLKHDLVDALGAEGGEHVLRAGGQAGAYWRRGRQPGVAGCTAGAVVAAGRQPVACAGTLRSRPPCTTVQSKTWYSSKNRASKVTDM